jgi:hypothetical protein
VDEGGRNGAAGRREWANPSPLIAKRGTVFGHLTYRGKKMQPLVPNTDDLISVLDRVLDKGIVMDKWASLSLQESSLIAAESRVASDYRVTVESSAVYVGYGKRGTWREDLELEDLFPFWRREFWSK